MAKRRFSFKKARARAGGFFKRARSYSKKGFGLLGKLPIVPFLYGLVRRPATGALSPIISKVPTDYNDEVVMSALAFIASKVVKGSAPIAKQIIDIEFYRMGELTGSMVMPGSTAGSGNFYV